MVCALGLGDQLAGVTHECDYPPEVVGKPIVVRNVLPLENMSQAEIDVAVAQRMRDGLSLYQVDEALLQELAPDLILTQNLCQVCAPSGNEVSEVLKLLTKKPNVLWLTPQSLQEIAANLRELGQATGRSEEAERLIATGRTTLEKIETTTGKLKDRPRVFCIEWLDPIYCSGHWMPEMVEIAGGTDPVALAQFLTFLWIPDPRTPFADAKSLEPGQALRWNADGRRLFHYGERLVPGATRTILFYIHFDGQPVDKAGWKQPDPWTPIIRAGTLISSRLSRFG